MHPEKQYLKALENIMENGVDRKGRNGFTRALFAIQMRFKMDNGFPALTTKNLAFRQVVAELLWFISGDSNVKKLQEMNCHIWDANAEAPYWKPRALFEGDLGRIYGVQWSHWKTPDGKEIDQLTDVIERIKNDPNDRRLVVSAWNPGELDQMALPPCHMIFQFFVANEKLSLHMIQRSCDMFLGVPFNIASYSLLLHMVAQITNLKPDEMIITLNDTHIYHAHFEQVKEQLQREPLPFPNLWLNQHITNIGGFTMGDIRLENYQHHPSIKAPMIV